MSQEGKDLSFPTSMCLVERLHSSMTAGEDGRETTIGSRSAREQYHAPCLLRYSRTIDKPQRSVSVPSSIDETGTYR